jgi:transposase
VGTDIFRTRHSTLDRHLPFLKAQWTGGGLKGAELWRRLTRQGVEGSLRVITEWATRQRRTEKARDQQLRKIPAVRSIARLMTAKGDNSTKSETVTVAVIEQGVRMLTEARALVDRFHAMIRKKAEIQLEPWIFESNRSLIASFATGIARQSRGPRSDWAGEVQITKLKLVKRQTFGRAKLGLLQARHIGAP